MKIAYILITAIALLVFLRASYYFIRLSSRDKSWDQYVLHIFPWIEVSLWVLFTFWALFFAFTGTEFHNILIISLSLALSILLSWYVFRDFIAGAVFRSEQSLDTGLEISSQKYSGTIMKLGYLSMDILTDNGDKLTIPYSQLWGTDLVRKTLKSRGKNQTITLEIPQHYGAQNTEQLIKRKLLELPWIIEAGNISVSMQPKGNLYQTQISFYSIKEDMFVKTEEILRHYINGILRGN
jgi:hypothetical protein